MSTSFLGRLLRAAESHILPTRGHTGMGESGAEHRQPLWAQVEGGRFGCTHTADPVEAKGLGCTPTKRR
jgi:hypothetical protein